MRGEGLNFEISGNLFVHAFIRYNWLDVPEVPIQHLQGHGK
jgi:hypothetical protein